MCAGEILTDSQLGKSRQSRMERHVTAVVASPISHPQPACTHIQLSRHAESLKHTAAVMTHQRTQGRIRDSKQVWIVGHAYAYEIHNIRRLLAAPDQVTDAGSAIHHRCNALPKGCSQAVQGRAWGSREHEKTGQDRTGQGKIGPGRTGHSL